MRSMGIGAMLVVLVVSIALLPVVIRYLTAIEPHYVISGFQDLNASAKMEDVRDQQVSSVGHTVDLPTWRPDPNTDYICRSPGGGSPCPEGTFCDGATQSCVAQYVGGEVPVEGYYA